MNVGGTRRLGQLGLVLLLGAMALVAVPAVPAAADQNAPPAGPVAGSGNVEGTEGTLEENLPPACFQTTKIIMNLGGEGTFHGRAANGSAVVYRAELASGQARLDGPLRVAAENKLLYYHGPYGTHGSDSTCSGASIGSPIEGDRIFDADNVYRLDSSGAQVRCAGSGTYVREGTSGDFHADWTLSGDCTVVGNEVAE